MSLERPNWFDNEDREMYNRLFYRNPGRELTEAELNFCITMSHYEEYAAGLDGADIKEQE